VTDRPIPFELIHPEEAAVMQRVFARGMVLLDRWPWIAPPRPRVKRKLTKYRETIAWIRSRPDREID
jgi:hypothetical protein